MDKKALEQFINDFYAAWRARDKEKIPTFYDENVKAYSDYSELTMQDILNRLEFSDRKFQEVNYNVEDMFIDEDEGKVAIRMKQRHVPRDGGEDTKWEAMMLYKIQDHKIKELWMSFYPPADYTNNNW